MTTTEFNHQDTCKKLHEYLMEQLSKPANEGKGYFVSVLDKFITTVEKYDNNDSNEELKTDLLNKFEESSIPELNKRALIKSSLENIEGLDSFKAYLNDIGF